MFTSISIDIALKCAFSNVAHASFQSGFGHGLKYMYSHYIIQCILEAIAQSLLVHMYSIHCMYIYSTSTLRTCTGIIIHVYMYSFVETPHRLFQYVFDYRPGDVYACVADIGWITGHSYVVYGPLCNGATTVLFESHPTYPDPGQ